MAPPLPPIAFALNLPSLDEARRAAMRVRGAIGMLKVGLELFIEAGPAAVLLGREVGLPVFLDLKLHDIPETVERAVARASALGARFVTVHASGGAEMLRRAVERGAKEGGGCSVVAVTVLTSIGAGDLATMGIGAGPDDHARRLATLAWEQGVRAFVCSPLEVGALRATLGPEAVLITPGIRGSAASPAGPGDDQKRIGTPRQAIRDGATWLVVGRPIRDAGDPLAAARAIAQEIEETRR